MSCLIAFFNFPSCLEIFPFAFLNTNEMCIHVAHEKMTQMVLPVLEHLTSIGTFSKVMRKACTQVLQEFKTSFLLIVT